jgi:hypothetical protein
VCYAHNREQKDRKRLICQEVIHASLPLGMVQ